MSDKKLHIIQKQLIDITLPNATAALEWEATKRRDFTALINKQLEKCFDDYDKNGDHLIIEKLDIDLGIFTMDNLQEEVSQRLYSELYKTLQERSKETIFAGAESIERNYSGQEGRLEALFYFLNRGYLPWWGSALADWDENWLKSFTENEVNRFKDFIVLSDEKQIRRLAIQFNDSFIEQLLQRFGVTVETGNAWRWLETLLKNLQDVAEPARYSDSFFQSYQRLLLPSIARTEYWLTWILSTVGKREIPALHKLFNDSPDALKIIYSVIKRKYADEKPDTFDKIPFLWEKEISAVIKQPQKKKDDKGTTATDSKELLETFSAEEIKLATKGKELLQVTGPAEGITKKSEDILSKLADGKGKIENEEEAIFVDNAGLIILHPFLPELFRHCGWLEKNKFLNDYAQTMAVYALHYLATGETAVTEHQLIFPKFLAGMEWETLLEPVEPLNDREQAACNELLGEVLKHWKPLRNTSPQGLREAYLQRNGKLEHIYSGWHLTIEQKTLDILLSKLPWGISLIKFPWVPQMLTVTWQ